MNGRRRCIALLLAAALVVGGCGGGDDEPDPAEERRGRMSERLEETFTSEQANCILGRLDDDLILELDQRANLAPDHSDLRTWSEILRACVTGETAAATEGSG